MLMSSLGWGLYDEINLIKKDTRELVCTRARSPHPANNMMIQQEGRFY